MDAGVGVEKPKVFVTNFAGHDYTDAERFGELTWITKGYVSFHSLDRVKFAICEKIMASAPQDWLLLSGIPVISALAAAFWYHRHKQVKLLVLDKKQKDKYRELIVTEKNFNDLIAVLTPTLESSQSNGA